MNRWKMLVSLVAPFVLGATSMALVVGWPAASAADIPRFEYKVIGASLRPGGYEEDLARWSGKGWRFVGSANNHLVLERRH